MAEAIPTHPWTVESTEAYVRTLYAGVTDKGGQPYAEHCVRVMLGLPADATNDERMAALLHDVIEDTPGTEGCLRKMGFPDRVVWLARRLSRESGPTYLDWIRSLATSGDVGLIRIKLADLADNLDPERVGRLPAKERKLVARYERAREMLAAALSRLARPEITGGRT